MGGIPGADPEIFQRGRLKNFFKAYIDIVLRYKSVHTHKINKRSTLSLFLFFPYHFFCFLFCFITLCLLFEFSKGLQLIPIIPPPPF